MVAEEKEATTSSLILDSLEVKNFRGFRHLQIEKLGRVNLVVGKNNVGKTALLEALRIYANRGKPIILWEALEARNEAFRSSEQRNAGFNSPEKFIDAIKHLFNGRTDTKPQTFHIGPVDSPSNSLIVLSGYFTTTGIELLGPLPFDASVRPVFNGLFINIGGGIAQTYSIDQWPPTLKSGPLTQPDETSCVFASAGGLNTNQILTFWNQTSLTSEEEDVLNSLRLISPNVERVSLRPDDLIPIVKVKWQNKPLPIRSLGEGMNRLFGIALALVNAKGGMLLIDEIESGLHYSVQPDVWKLIFETAARLNVQVFATTHSWDCIEAFQKAATASDEEGMLIRLAEKKGEIIPTLFDERRVSIATREDIEIR